MVQRFRPNQNWRARQGLENEASAKNLLVHWRVRDDPAASADPALLAVVVRNVLDNAVAYTPEGGSLQIEAYADEAVCRLCVRNACALQPEEIDHVFERYWRADAVRRDTGLHCGLGLALVKTIAEAMGGSVSARLTPAGEFELSMEVPR